MIPIDERDARYIKMLRMDLKCTFGRIGELYEREFGAQYNGSIEASGAALCEWSRSLLGQEWK